MERIGGFLILFGLFVLGRAAYEGATGVDGAFSTALVGIFFVGVGYYLVNRRPIELPKHEPELSATTSTVGDAEESTGASEPPEAIFSVIQTGDDAVLDKVERLLEQDPRITAIVSESGRWYSSPDRDDLPEWNALRAYCNQELVDRIMEDSEAKVRAKLGKEAAAKLTFSRFS